MNPTLKIAANLLFLGLYFVLFCFVWLENTQIQILGLMLVLVYSAIVFRPAKLLSKLQIILPFVLFLAGFYALFAVFQIAHNTAYWVHYGLTRTILLVSTLLLMWTIIHSISMQSLLNLPVSIHKLKYLILGKLLYQQSTAIYTKLCVCVNDIPTEQSGKKGFKTKLRSKLTVLLALVVYVIQESTLRGEMIDERIEHCYGSSHNAKSLKRKHKE